MRCHHQRRWRMRPSQRCRRKPPLRKPPLPGTRPTPVEVRPKEVPRHLRSSPPASGETWASKRGVEPSSGGCKPAVRSMKRSLPRRNSLLRKEPTGGRVREGETKAKDGVKSLERQPRRTQRRKGRGTLAQPSWEQERAVSAPAVRPVGCQLAGGLGAPSPISREERRSG